MLVDLSLKLQSWHDCTSWKWNLSSPHRHIVGWEVVCFWAGDFFGPFLQICEKQLSHRDNALLSLLEDTHLAPKQQLKMEVKFFTSL